MREVHERPETRCPPCRSDDWEALSLSFPVPCEPFLCALTAGEKQSSKTTGSPGHQREPKCPTRHAIPPGQGHRFGSAGREATWSLIMKPRGLLLPFATGAESSGSSPQEHLQATGLNKWCLVMQSINPFRWRHRLRTFEQSISMFSWTVWVRGRRSAGVSRANSSSHL